jgi:hypothetical protein
MTEAGPTKDVADGFRAVEVIMSGRIFCASTHINTHGLRCTHGLIYDFVKIQSS